MAILPSLQQLRFLCALAEQCHFSRAAESCAVTQSTLSAGIKELEARLGITLFERNRRHVMLTPLGERDRDASPAPAGRRRGPGRVAPQRAGAVVRAAPVRCNPDSRAVCPALAAAASGHCAAEAQAVR